MPQARDLPPGCRFEPRCPRAAEICRSSRPGACRECARTSRGLRAADRTSDMTELLRAVGLTKHFPVLGGPLGLAEIGKLRAVDGVDLSVARGEVWASSARAAAASRPSAGCRTRARAEAGRSFVGAEVIGAAAGRADAAAAVCRWS